MDSAPSSTSIGVPIVHALLLMSYITGPSVGGAALGVTLAQAINAGREYTAGDKRPRVQTAGHAGAPPVHPDGKEDPKTAHKPPGSFIPSFPMVGEMKCFDTVITYVSGSADVNGTHIQSLNLVPQGAAQAQRVGRTIRIHNIEFVGSRGFLPGTAIPPNLTIQFVLDTQANGALATPTDLMTGPGPWIADMVNVSNYQRFEILKRNDYLAVATVTNNSTPNEVWHPYHYRSKQDLNFVVDFSGATGAITEIRSNNLLMAIGGTRDLARESYLNGRVRICYTDN